MHAAIFVTRFVEAEKVDLREIRYCQQERLAICLTICVTCEPTLLHLIISRTPNFAVFRAAYCQASPLGTIPVQAGSPAWRVM